MTGLTQDQRWLLATMGGWEIVWALHDPAGTQHLMASRWGRFGSQAIDGAPEWMTSFETDSGKIISPSRGPAKVTLTPAQINRFAKQLPADITAELRACRAASQAEARRVKHWCWCSYEEDCLRSNAGDPLYGNRHHPTDDEDQASIAEVRRIRVWESDVLAKALGLLEEPTAEQLELFAGAS